MSPSAIEARAELRCFGHGLIAALQPLLFNGRTLLQQARRMPSEHYLVACVGDDANVKLRAGLLDLKLRTERTPEGFEVYTPRGKWPLPVDGEGLREVCAALGVAPPQGDTPLDAPALLAWARGHAQLRVVEVEKQRFGFLLDGVIGEYAQVWMNGALLETVCLESADRAALGRVAGELQLLGQPNTGYVQAARRLLGL